MYELIVAKRNENGKLEYSDLSAGYFEKPTEAFKYFLDKLKENSSFELGYTWNLVDGNFYAVVPTTGGGRLTAQLKKIYTGGNNLIKF